MALVQKRGKWVQRGHSDGFKRSRQTPRLWRSTATIQGIHLNLVEGYDHGENTLTLNTNRWHSRLHVSDSMTFVPKEYKDAAVRHHIPASIPYTGYVYRSHLTNAEQFKHDLTLLMIFDPDPE